MWLTKSVRPRGTEPEPMNATECSRTVLGPGRSIHSWSSKRTLQVARTRAQNSRMSRRTARHETSMPELVTLGWNQVELESGRMHVGQAKDGTPSVHPIRRPEIRALRRLTREYTESPYVFVTELKGPLTDLAVRKMIARAGKNAGFDFPIHPHRLICSSSTILRIPFATSVNCSIERVGDWVTTVKPMAGRKFLKLMVAARNSTGRRFSIL